MLNVWAAALLFQPVEEHMVRKYKEPEEDEDGPQVSCGKDMLTANLATIVVSWQYLW